MGGNLLRSETVSFEMNQPRHEDLLSHCTGEIVAIELEYCILGPVKTLV